MGRKIQEKKHFVFSLNALHDDASQNGCRSTDGYVMAPSSGVSANLTKNLLGYEFSPCSLEYFDQYIRGMNEWVHFLWYSIFFPLLRWTQYFLTLYLVLGLNHQYVSNYVWTYLIAFRHWKTIWMIRFRHYIQMILQARLCLESICNYSYYHVIILWLNQILWWLTLYHYRYV